MQSSLVLFGLLFWRETIKPKSDIWVSATFSLCHRNYLRFPVSRPQSISSWRNKHGFVKQTNLSLYLGTRYIVFLRTRILFYLLLSQPLFHRLFLSFISSKSLSPREATSYPETAHFFACFSP